MTPPKLMPALLGGAFIGVLSALPLVNVANCCCLWLVAGGALAAYVMQQNHPAPIRAGDGAAVGFLAGVVGAFAYVVVAAPINLVMAPMAEAMRDRMLQGAEEMPGEVRDAITRFGSGGAGLAFGFVMSLFLGMVFSTLGGLLGAVLFKKAGPPAPPAGDPTWMPPPSSADSRWAPPPPAAESRWTPAPPLPTPPALPGPPEPPPESAPPAAPEDRGPQPGPPPVKE